MDNHQENTVIDQTKQEETLKQNLGTMMIIVTSKNWIALITVFTLLLGIFIWSLKGGIPDEISGEGFLINGPGNFIVEAEQEGFIDQIFFDQGDFVEQGDLVLQMRNYSLELELEDAYSGKRLAVEQKKVYDEREKLRVKRETQALLEEISQNEDLVKMTINEIAFLNEELKWQQELNREGLITLLQINQTQIKINHQQNILKQCKVEIEKAKSQLVQVEDLLKKQEFEERLEKIDNKIKELELKKELLSIRAPFTGRILTIPFNAQNIIKVGQRLVWGEKLEKNERDFEVYSYFTSEKAQRIQPGMVAFVRLSDVDYKLYGDLVGEVIAVSDFPVSSTDVYKIIGNENIVNSITKSSSEAPLKVLIRPIEDLSNPSGFKWTSKTGPNIKLRSGVLGQVKVRVRNRHPIEFIFPLIRSLKNSVVSQCVEKNDG